jgi:uncharacterized protein YqjF (DUF2071 family)
MIASAPCEARTGAISRRARECIARPLLRGGWLDALFLHYEVAPEILQPCVPFPLDTREGYAYVSLVWFTLSGLHCSALPRTSRWMLRPISDHAFLNVRTYVRNGDAPGIYFLAEWLSSRLPVALGRPTFGLPYRFGQFERGRDPASGCLNGVVANRRGCLRFHADPGPSPTFTPCAAGSLDEFLLERYTAFTQWGRLRRYFRVWHPPWPVAPLAAVIDDASLLDETGPWRRGARLVTAHHSPGVSEVWMGAPRFLPASPGDGLRR